MKNILVICMLLMTNFVGIKQSKGQLYDHPFVQSKSTAAKTVDIVSVEIQKNRTVVEFNVRNETGNTRYFTFHGIDDPRCHYVEDAATKTVYKQKFTFSGIALLGKDVDFQVDGKTSRSFTLYFQKLDPGVKEINIIEGTGNRGATWDFYGIKLLTPKELEAWKQAAAEREQAQTEALAAKKQAEVTKAANEKEQHQKELQAQEEQQAREQAVADAKAIQQVEQRTKRQTLASPIYDGAYCQTNNGFIQIKAAPMQFGKIGYYLGNHDIFRTYFLPSTPEYVIVPATNPKFILIGDLATQVSGFDVSEVENIRQTKALVAVSFQPDKAYTDHNDVIYTPFVTDDIKFPTYSVKRRTISNTKAELIVEGALPADKNYVLWNQTTGKYFFFKVK